MNITYFGIFLVLAVVGIFGTIMAFIASAAFFALGTGAIFMIGAIGVTQVDPKQTISLTKKKANPEFIKQMEHELGMGDLDEITTEKDDGLPWLKKYPLPEGWSWSFEKEDVITTNAWGDKTTQPELAIYLRTSEGNKWSLIGGKRSPDDRINNTKWVRPLPTQTFERRFEERVEATYTVVMEKIKGQQAIDDVVNKYGGKKVQW